MRLSNYPSTLIKISLHVIAVLAIAAFMTGLTVAQTPGGTVISNQASATYSDGTNSYSTVSNTVTVTVSNVSGLTITPDAGSNPSVVAGETGVVYNFTVTNTGNFSNQVRFLASGASVRVNGPGTITRAVIDVNGDGLIDAGDTDILTNGAAVDSANIAQIANIHVLVEVSVNAGATAGQSVQFTDTSTDAQRMWNYLDTRFSHLNLDTSQSGCLPNLALGWGGLLDSVTRIVRRDFPVSLGFFLGHFVLARGKCTKGRFGLKADQKF